MNRPAVFVDTNCVDNRSSATNFFGNRLELEKLANRAKIILPQVVHDELVVHIKTYLRGQLDGMRRNPHRHYFEIKDEHIDALNIDEMVSKIEKNESIAFEVLNIENVIKTYESIYRHAIEGTPPFERNGDKGFKDTLIAKTIDEYLERETEEAIFLLTKDERLTEYFKDNDAVTVIQTYGEFDNKYSQDKLNDYLIERVRDFLAENENIKINIHVQRSWLNWEGDLVGVFTGPAGTQTVRIDADNREPIDYASKSLDDYILELENTPNFRRAHDNLRTLNGLMNFLSKEHSDAVFLALTQNDQLYSIGQDIDIKQAVVNFSKLLEGFALNDKLEIIRKQYALISELDHDDDIGAISDYIAEMQSDIERGH